MTRVDLDRVDVELGADLLGTAARCRLALRWRRRTRPMMIGPSGIAGRERFHRPDRARDFGEPELGACRTPRRGRGPQLRRIAVRPDHPDDGATHPQPPGR